MRNATTATGPRSQRLGVHRSATSTVAVAPLTKQPAGNPRSAHRRQQRSCSPITGSRARLDRISRAVTTL